MTRETFQEHVYQASNYEEPTLEKARSGLVLEEKLVAFLALHRKARQLILAQPAKHSPSVPLSSLFQSTWRQLKVPA